MGTGDHTNRIRPQSCSSGSAALTSPSPRHDISQPLRESEGGYYGYYGHYGYSTMYVPGYLLFNILQARARHIGLVERVSVAAAVKALKARLVTPCQPDTQATPDATQISEIGTMCWRSAVEWLVWFNVGFVKLCGIRFFERLCFGDDEHGCVMVDAVGSGHLAVSECRLNIGHAIPHRAMPYHIIPGHTMAYDTVECHSTQCTIEYWLGPLGRANCPGAPLHSAA